VLFGYWLGIRNGILPVIKSGCKIFPCEEHGVNGGVTETRACCVCQEKDLKSYMEECGNILNINNVKVVTHCPFHAE